MRSIKKSSRTCVVRDELAERVGSLFCGKATAVAACRQEPPFESHPRQEVFDYVLTWIECHI